MNNSNNLRSNNSFAFSRQIAFRNTFTSDDWNGILIGIAILSLWLASLSTLLSVSVLNTSWFWLIISVLARTFLHTGLFILAHDAMHGNLVSSNRTLNNIIGRIAVGIYAFLPYDRCNVNHANHHSYPSQIGDPDFHGSLSHPIFWYCKFIGEYFSWRSLIIFLVSMVMIFGGLILIFKVDLINLILFWLVPLVLSSLQLFFFGTYLPHHQVSQNPNFSPRIESNFYSILWSFLSCYHFGHYHWEHHEYPKIPWYRLHRIH
jgi:beta-carotene ketolase (CrtW type)